MNKKFNQRVYDILSEGKSTGDSPTQTGMRVGRAIKTLKAKNKYGPQKQEQVADIGTRVSSRQGRVWSQHIRTDSNTKEQDRTIATIRARRRYQAGMDGSPGDSASRERASMGKRHRIALALRGIADAPVKRSGHIGTGYS